MGYGTTLSRSMLAMTLVLGLLAVSRPAEAQNTDHITPTWTLGSGVGLMGNTPGGTAFNFNVYADRFMGRSFSLGPLVQIARTGNEFQTAVSAQGKYWIDLLGAGDRLKANLQAGLGFIHADYMAGDTSWVIPVGVGIDYILTREVAVTGTFLLNFADLHTGQGTGHVMPAVTVGLRF